MWHWKVTYDTKAEKGQEYAGELTFDTEDEAFEIALTMMDSLEAINYNITVWEK